MANMVRELLTVAAAYAEAMDLPLKTVSSRVFDDSSKLESLREGSDILTARFERAMLWFSTEWPPRTAWPKGIKRPAPSEAE